MTQDSHLAKKPTQPQKLELLLKRKYGVTAMEIVQKCGTTCPHKRMSELKAKGWTIRREPVKGRNYGRYYGAPPAKFRFIPI